MRPFAHRSPVGLLGLVPLLAWATTGCGSAPKPENSLQPVPAMPPMATAPGILRSVDLDPATDTLSVGDQVRLQATARDWFGAPIPEPTLEWSSLNERVASVNWEGLVLAKEPGTALIRVELAGVVAVASIVVTPRD